MLKLRRLTADVKLRHLCKLPGCSLILRLQSRGRLLCQQRCPMEKKRVCWAKGEQVAMIVPSLVLPAFCLGIE